MKIQEIIERNKNLQSQARELNKRAGQEVFPVMTQSQWKQWLAERINGARNAGEILDLEKIRLPELDPEIVRLIHDENPDQIEILGQMRQVEYPGIGYDPRVEIRFEDVAAWDISTRLPIWCGIPDEGYRLPGGRQVEIRFKKGFYGFVSGENGKEIKDKILSKLNSAQFENWPANRPEIHIPNPDDETSLVPDIVKAEYGRCVIYDTPLIAFGTVYSLWSDSVLSIRQEVRWFQALTEAEEVHSSAVKRLKNYRSERRKEKALTAIQLPDPSHEDAVIPEIAEIEGGFGIVVVNSYRSSYGNDPWFKIHWTQNCEEAEKMREAAVAKLAEIKAEEIRKRQLAETKDEAEVAKAKACELYYHSDSDRLEQALKDRLYKIHFSYPPSELEGMKAWTFEAKAVCSQAEKSYAEIARKRTERQEMGVQIPNELIRAYNGNEDRAYEFMQKVARLQTRKLDEHIVCQCGRESVRSHLVQVSGDDEFFLGADPNDVKYYVRRVHYCGENFGIPLASSVKEAEVISPDNFKAPTTDALAALRAKFGRK